MPDRPARHHNCPVRPARAPAGPTPALCSGAGSRARGTGSRGEQLAALHLERCGFAILDRNVRTGAGEIDLVAGDGTTIAFVEVKTTRLPTALSRSADSRRLALERALERLGPGQRRRLRALALDWLRSQPQPGRRGARLRFDAIGVVIDGAGALVALEHLQDAW
jgi:putative endonuclease